MLRLERSARKGVQVRVLSNAPIWRVKLPWGGRCLENRWNVLIPRLGFKFSALRRRCNSEVECHAENMEVASSKLAVGTAEVAQWQSSCFVNNRLEVRVLSSAYTLVAKMEKQPHPKRQVSVRVRVRVPIFSPVSSTDRMSPF